MRHRSRAQRWLRRSATGAGFALGGYVTFVGLAWLRYGRAPAIPPDERDAVLDSFMPQYDVRTRHEIDVAAPAAVTMATAREMDLQQSPIARGIFRAREVILRARPGSRAARGLMAEMQALGWGVLADLPEREVVVGAVTRPWEANVVFRAVPAEAFARFDEPGYVKIAWTLRADAIDATHSRFSSETRAVATDAAARRRFRRYWALFSPGMILIRWLTLGPLRAEAERRLVDSGRFQGSKVPRFEGS